MISEEAYISRIESYLMEKLKVVSTNYVYAGNLPSTLPTKLKTDEVGFVVVDCATAMRDYDAYVKGMVNIYLYAPPTSTGGKNVAALYKLEQRYREFLESSDTDTYVVEESYRLTDYDSNYGTYFIISAINLIVK
jgi:hypothetical protein